jgi:hypothetical protein
MDEATPSLRRDYLAALGIEPLVLRAVARPAGAVAGSLLPATESLSIAPVVKRGTARLQLRMDEADPFAGPHAVLLRSVVRALGLDPGDVCFEPRAAVPVLAFDHADAQAHAITLASLRDGRAKRAFWPTLRRLRVRLRSSEIAS